MVPKFKYLAIKQPSKFLQHQGRSHTGFKFVEYTLLQRLNLRKILMHNYCLMKEIIHSDFNFLELDNIFYSHLF